MTKRVRTLHWTIENCDGRQLTLVYEVYMITLLLIIDWGNPSQLTSVILLIDLGKPYKLHVGSRTSLMDLATAFIFMLVL